MPSISLSRSCLFLKVCSGSLHPILLLTNCSGMVLFGGGIKRQCQSLGFFYLGAVFLLLNSLGASPSPCCTPLRPPSGSHTPLPTNCILNRSGVKIPHQERGDGEKEAMEILFICMYISERKVSGSLGHFWSLFFFLQNKSEGPHLQEIIEFVWKCVKAQGRNDQ